MTIRQQAIQLCDIAASCDDNASLDTIALRTEANPSAADLADEACNACTLDALTIGYTWRELWAEAAQRLREGWTP